MTVFPAPPGVDLALLELDWSTGVEVGPMALIEARSIGPEDIWEASGYPMVSASDPSEQLEKVSGNPQRRCAESSVSHIGLEPQWSGEQIQYRSRAFQPTVAKLTSH